MSIVEQLRQKQQAAGLKSPERDDGDDTAPIAPGVVPIPVARPTIAEADYNGAAGRGYIKIFPPKVSSIAELTPEWILANWFSPSPWCSIEGMENHPEFGANLAGVEK